MDDDKSSSDQIQDAEIVPEGEDATAKSSSNPDTLILENLESMIRQNLVRIDKLNEEAKNLKEMVDSVLLNDETYQNHDEVAKQAQKVRSSTKSEILKRPDVVTTVLKLKEVKEEIKDIRESMNSYLSEYQRLSGSSEIENDRGEVMQIVYVAKLVKIKP